MTDINDTWDDEEDRAQIARGASARGARVMIDKFVTPCPPPEGHIRRCSAMFGHVPTDTYCDWSPSRFRPRSTASQDPQP